MRRPCKSYTVLTAFFGSLQESLFQQKPQSVLWAFVVLLPSSRLVSQFDGVFLFLVCVRVGCARARRPTLPCAELQGSTPCSSFVTAARIVCSERCWLACPAAPAQVWQSAAVRVGCCFFCSRCVPRCLLVCTVHYSLRTGLCDGRAMRVQFLSLSLHSIRCE